MAGLGSGLASWLSIFGVALLDDGPRLALVAALYVVFALLERRFPAQTCQGRKGRARNVGYGVIFVVAGLAASSAILAVYPIDPPLRAGQASLLSSLGSCLGMLFVMDACFYAYHRAQHRFPILWAIHELHHADAELNVTTSLRTYWLEGPLQFLVVSLPALFLIGVDPFAIAIFPFVSTVVLLFSHANLRLRLGWLTPIVVGPQLHRLHHSDLPKHQDRNFAQIFPILDVVFGTYRPPRPDEFPTTGTPTLASDAPVGAVLVRPFRLAARAVRPQAAVRPPRRAMGSAKRRNVAARSR
jgi:sterol desaturase/sphingolipid hydroxylase (fatty acid hydroxylase superfamily)